MLQLGDMSTAKIVLFHQGITELRRCENCVFFLPVNILTGVTRRLLGPHDTLPCVLISLVRSQLMFCSSLWKPYLLKDIRQLEQLQRRTTKYILNDYTSNYKSRLLELKILPLMYVLDMCDIMFFIKSLKAPTNAFNVTDYNKFTSGNT